MGNISWSEHPPQGKRMLVEDPAVPETSHVIAVLVANAPLGVPMGAIYMRYATLSFEYATSRDPVADG